MESSKIREVLEALLFSADVPLRTKTLAEVLGDRVGAREIGAAVKELNARYEEVGASFRIEEIASGLQLLSKPEFDGWIKKLAKARQRARLSRAALETLAIVAYRQPLTRPAIEAIRGVDAGGVLGTLLERGLVRISGRAETVGRPHLYATTPLFLNHFGLKSLAKLPRMEEITQEMDRQGLVQDLAAELGEDPEALGGAIDAFIGGDGAGVGAANGAADPEAPETPEAPDGPEAEVVVEGGQSGSEISVAEEDPSIERPAGDVTDSDADAPAPLEPVPEEPEEESAEEEEVGVADRGAKTAGSL